MLLELCAIVCYYVHSNDIASVVKTYCQKSTIIIINLHLPLSCQSQLAIVPKLVCIETMVFQPCTKVEASTVFHLVIFSKHFFKHFFIQGSL